MVANPENLSHFVFNSDYPIDKVVWLYEGSQAAWADESVVQEQDIPVNKLLGSKIAIFIKGSYSIDNWKTSWMIGSKDDGHGGFIEMSWALVAPDYTSNGINLFFQGNFPRFYPGKTIKYRLWGVCREDTRDAVNYSKNASKTKSKLIFNTDLNYPRLYKDGVAKSGETITHNLGRIPHVDYWVNSNNKNFNTYWSYQPYSSFTNSSPFLPGIRATDKTLTFLKYTFNDNNGYADNDVYYYYRIYI